MREERQRMSSLMTSQTTLLADKTAEMEHLEKLLASADENLNAIRFENDALRARVAEAKTGDLNVEIERLRGEIDELRSAQVAKIQTEPLKSSGGGDNGWEDSFEPVIESDNTSRLASVEAELAKVNEAKKELQIQNVDLLAEVDSLRAEKEELEANLRAIARKNELEGEMTRLLGDVRSSEEAIVETQAIYKQLSENLIEWQKSNEVIEKEILALKERNVELESSRTGELGDLERIRQIEAEKSDLERRLVDLRGEMLLMTAENRALTERRDELTSRLNELRELSQDFDALRADYIGVSSLNGKLSEDIRIANERNDKLTDHYELRVHSLLEEIEKKDAEIEKLKADIGNYDNGNKKFV